LECGSPVPLFPLRLPTPDTPNLTRSNWDVSTSLIDGDDYAPAMRCIVTAGPTYEPLDDVRRLTNSSTGRLGSELASFLTARKHEVTLLIGHHATFQGSRHAHRIEVFTTTNDLREKLRSMGGDAVDVVFHAAAVSDFRFGKVWVRSDQGELTEIKSGKISTRQGTLLAELLATPKI